MPDFLESLSQAPPIVCADAHKVSLHFRPGELQSLMSVHSPNQLEIPYTKTMMAFLLINPDPVHILMIGLGGGSMAKFCYQHLPNTRITVVEINPQVIALRSRFAIPDDDARFSIVCADGADFVRDTPQAFDVILADGFDLCGQSAQLTTRNFYENCRRALLPKGVLVANLDSDHPDHTEFLLRMHKAFKGVTMEICVEHRSNHIVLAV
jgi:spermidine synthase